MDIRPHETRPAQAAGEVFGEELVQHALDPEKGDGCIDETDEQDGNEAGPDQIGVEIRYRARLMAQAAVRCPQDPRHGKSKPHDVDRDQHE